MKGRAFDGVEKATVKIHGGVRASHNKNTANSAIVRMPEPEKVVLPMQQHIGVPCVPTVKVGDTVSVGQLIGDSDKPVSAPIHASISGKVTAINEIKLSSGIITQAVTIESDGEMRHWEGIEPPVVNNREDFIKAVRASGLVGLGGAGFPTHYKLNYPRETQLDTLIVNAAECEPYITVDYRECVENAKNIISGVHTLCEILEIKNAVIAVEDNKPEAIKKLKEILDSYGESGKHIRLMMLKSVYPQGAEKMIIRSATGRKVPPGKLPTDVGCMVMNVATVAFIARYLRKGKPLVSRSVTIDGSAIADPKNLRVPIGTEINEILDLCGGFKSEPLKIILGGPMMGLSLVDTSLPLLKSNNAILAFSEEDYNFKAESACIRCGRCAHACPLGLMPTLIERFARARDVGKLSKVGVNVCMECGSCAYSCPSGKPLVQYMRLAKQVLRESGDKK